MRKALAIIVMVVIFIIVFKIVNFFFGPAIGVIGAIIVDSIITPTIRKIIV
jgi:hypothetical protein